MREDYSKSSRPKVNLVTPDLEGKSEQDPVDDRQRRVPGFDREALASTTALLVGCGGLGSWYGMGLVKKGIGRLKCLDPDRVELSNLSRQYFYGNDLHRPKAGRLINNLRKEGTLGTRLSARNLTFQQAKEEGYDLSSDLIVAGVDNDEARLAVSRHALEEEIPAIITGVSRDADRGYLFVQEVDGPCFSCLFPDAADKDRTPCAKTPAVLDILMLMAGYVLYAVDSLVMERDRDWNYLRRFLSSSRLDCGSRIERRSDCPLCGEG